MMCMQRMVDIRRVQTRWRATHPRAWERYSPRAAQLCRTFSKQVRPCQFCGSNAKQSETHAVQCPMLFQAFLMRQHLTQGTSEQMVEKPRDILPRCSEQDAKHKHFDLKSTSFGKAFLAGASQLPHTQRRVTMTHSTSTKPETAAVSQDAPTQPQTAGSGHSVVRKTVSVLDMLRGNSGPGVRGLSFPSGRVWTLNLRLRNPHSLCYLNASLHSMVHFLVEANIEACAAICSLCKRAVEGGQTLSLRQQLVVRSVFPG